MIFSLLSPFVQIFLGRDFLGIFDPFFEQRKAPQIVPGADPAAIGGFKGGLAPGDMELDLAVCFW